MSYSIIQHISDCLEGDCWLWQACRGGRGKEDWALPTVKLERVPFLHKSTLSYLH